VAAGAYVLIRLAPLFAPLGWFGPAIAVIGTISALTGGVVASLQTDFKRVLAGSTTAQYGLMFIAIGAASTTAALAQLIVHAFFKSLLFLGAGVALTVAGTGDLARLRLGSSQRVVALLFGVGVLALGAVPILGGGISKEAIISAAMEDSIWLGAGVLVIGFMSAFYGGRLFLLAFGPTGDDLPGALRTPASFRSGPPARGRIMSTEIWTMGFLAAASALLVLLRVPAVWRALELVTLPRRTGEHLVHIALSLLASAVAFAAVVVLDRRGLLLSLGLAPATQAKVSDWLGFPTVVRRGISEPVFAIARLLRRLDDLVIDAGIWGVARSVVRFAGRIRLLDERVVDGAVRGVGRFAIRSSSSIRLLDERVIDGAVRGIAALGMFSSTTSGIWDDRGFDGAVEGIARASWWSGKQIRRLQTGLAHHYYVIVAVGLVLAVAFAAIRN
jgi:NADH-quinone oxidoreductase subunit L